MPHEIPCTEDFDFVVAGELGAAEDWIGILENILDCHLHSYCLNYFDYSSYAAENAVVVVIVLFVVVVFVLLLVVVSAAFADPTRLGTHLDFFFSRRAHHTVNEKIYLERSQ